MANENSGASAAAWGQLGAQAAGGLFGWLGAKKQHKRNLELAQFQADANERYLQQQLEWDSPVNQMKRFKEAGLNPHLIYGSGTPGNQSQPLRYPDIKVADVQQIAPQAIQLGNQTALAMSQVQAVNAKTVKDSVQTGLYRLQGKVLERNPLLDEAGFKAIIDGLVSSADIKAAEAGLKDQDLRWRGTQITDMKRSGKDIALSPIGFQIMERQLDMLDQKFSLGTQDSRIKSQILQSKEFQNALLEVQKQWMTNADITPQHIYQFIQMLLMKML